MRVLISIKPEYVKKIFNESKKFEYRKTTFANPNIKTVVIYATRPCGKVVGEFNVESIFYNDPKTLWKKIKDYAGVSKEYFYIK